MNTTEILNKLDGVFETANGWQARCPAHDDRKASLSIAEDGGKTLLYCQAGCDTAAVVAAIGMQMRDLYANQSPPRRRLVETYDYTDEYGQLLYQTCRFDPKDFRARRPDGNGGWIYSVDGVRLVPYRLPKVKKFDGLLITEGEKDADTGRFELRLPTTTNPFGAGKWRDEYSAYFEGKFVVLCPHRDNPGREHMQAVACSLFSVARKIKIVELPFGKDLAEFCALGGNRDRFKALVKMAPAITAEQVQSWRPIEPLSPDELEDKSIGELMAEPEQKTEWLCDGLLPQGGSSLGVAKAKVGKTTAARCFAAAVVKGRKFLTRRTNAGPVLYFVGIEEKASTIRHFRKLGLTADDAVRVISSTVRPNNFAAKLEGYIQRHRPKLVVLDPYMRFLGIDDVNDYAKTMKAFTPIISLAPRYKVHIMFVGHFGKAERFEVSDQVLGSTAIFGMVDTGIFLKEGPYSRTIQTKQRHTNEYGNLPETELIYDAATGWVSLGTTKEKADVNRVEKAILAFLQQSTTPQTEEMIDSNVQGNTRLLREALRQLVNDGQVQRTTAPKEKAGRGRNPYVYSIQPSR